MKRYEMAVVVGLEDNLRCAEDDKLEAFGATAKVDASDGTLRVYRLMALGSATICAAVSAKKPAVCKRLADKLTNAVVKAFSRAAVRGEEETFRFHEDRHWERLRDRVRWAGRQVEFRLGAVRKIALCLLSSR